MSSLRRVCVFAGSSAGAHPEYLDAARALGSALAARRLTLVYGGAGIGLMGAVADAVLASGGEVIGVMPRGLFRREVAHPDITELREVGSMHERKALMADLADAFIALPGGYGTFDELFEIVTWAQVGLHAKPIGLLDARGYFQPLLALVTHAIEEGFVPADHVSLLLRELDPDALLARLSSYTPPAHIQKWTALPRP
jgi:uncharacterized protein (TIGR00730 family)